MRDGLRFTTEESSLYVVRSLTQASVPTFTIHIPIPNRSEDQVTTVLLPVLVDCIGGLTATFVAANGDRTYRTMGRFEENGKRFELDVTIHSRQADLTGATIALSDAVLSIFHDIEER